MITVKKLKPGHYLLSSGDRSVEVGLLSNGWQWEFRGSDSPSPRGPYPSKRVIKEVWEKFIGSHQNPSTIAEVDDDDDEELEPARERTSKMTYQHFRESCTAEEIKRIYRRQGELRPKYLELFNRGECDFVMRDAMREALDELAREVGVTIIPSDNDNPNVI